ncbi:MAG: 23S rRNA (uridine(2552)-2'-O)-methyltransferase RlmE [Candidatus Thiosymbion ectosymbiont of Robbea hypermnestra]|nr:23S rRNA (uridine(2552)-2'-O)-methyltransferase RlmE [Candidatus Thiosymbion ectosymbiont of Robbea hypermnestra]
MSTTSRSKSSRRWLDRHFNDAYVKRAREEGYRSRAAYKLLELQAKERLLGPGMSVVDLGAAPGGWSQAAARIVGPRGRIVALDLLPMEPIPNVTFIQADFREEVSLARLREALKGAAVDLVLSDLAPNMSGNPAVDQPRGMVLCELVLELARQVQKPGGALVVKTFQGEGFEAFHKELRAAYRRVAGRKPKSSRPGSRELYLVATGYSIVS